MELCACGCALHSHEAGWCCTVKATTCAVQTSITDPEGTELPMCAPCAQWWRSGQAERYVRRPSGAVSTERTLR